MGASPGVVPSCPLSPGHTEPGSGARCSGSGRGKRGARNVTTAVFNFSTTTTTTTMVVVEPQVTAAQGEVLAQLHYRAEVSQLFSLRDTFSDLKLPQGQLCLFNHTFLI